jgi:acyl-CoA reductase-like NAD-dependent aldehyde dehydrogenase
MTILHQEVPLSSIKTETVEWIKYNPATGEALATYHNPTAEAVAQQITLAQQAQVVWATLPFNQRLQVLKYVEQLLVERADTLALTISQEVGKPLAEAYQSDLLSARLALTHAIKQGKRLFEPHALNWHKGLLFGRSFTQRTVAKGVIAVISPWNYPIGTPMSGLAGALLAGNAIVFKPSEKTPACGIQLAQLFTDALVACGCSSAVFQLVNGTGVVGKQLVESSQVKMVFFTGSQAVGRWIHTTCAAQNKPCTLELGGSDPLIILPSAAQTDLDAAVSYALWGRFSNAGQTCAAVKRLLVPQALLPQVQALLLDKLAQLQVGNPLDSTTHMGPVIDAQQLIQLQAQLADAQALGVTIFQATIRMENQSIHQTFFPPTVLWNVPPQATVLTQEVFGPILPIVTYETVDEAIAHCNALPYGLTANVFGTTAEAKAVATYLQYAHIGINDVAMCHYPLTALPWHGWKESGPGIRNGDVGLHQFVDIQIVGETIGYDWYAFLRKAPWLFGQQGQCSVGTKALFTTMGGASWWKLPPWAFFRYLWSSRSSNKL